MAIEFVPVQDAPDSLIRESIASVLDELAEDSPVAERMWARVRAIREGEYPAACDILLKDWHGVGWSGWFPLWTNPYAAWSSATYLAPSLRGKGLLPILRCRQAHAAEEIIEKLEEGVEFVSSIDTANLRSLRASHKYAKASGWPNEWYLRDDRENNRMLLRMVWPAPPSIPHECFLGRALPIFEEPIHELDIEFADEAEQDLALVVDTWVRRKTEIEADKVTSSPS